MWIAAGPAAVLASVRRCSAAIVNTSAKLAVRWPIRSITMSGSPGSSSWATAVRDAALMSGLASALTTRPASPYRSGARSAAASALPG